MAMASSPRMAADLEYAYALQMEEAIAASMAQAEAAIQGENRERKREEEGEEEGDGSGVYCDQEYDVEVRALKTPEGHVGIGVVLTDPGSQNRVLWQQSRYAGHGLSWHIAEYGGLLEAMEVAERLGVQYLNCRLSSKMVSDQVNGFCKPKLANQWRLLNQVHDAMQTFDSFSIEPCPKGTVNVAVNQLAQAAIASHLAGDASSSSAGASTSGAIDNVTEHAGIADDSRRVTKENCLICLDDKTSSEMATVKKCRHKFCVACMQKHAEVQVQVNQVPVRCPQAACPEVLEYPDECKKYLTQEIFSILTKRLIEAKVPEGDRVYCPYANCSTLMDKSGLNIPEGNSSSTATSSLYQKVECVECLRSFCLDCRVPWHWNRSCQDYQNLPPDQRDAEESNLYTLAKNQKWQRCKKCRRMIELAEGCYHMTCRCGYEFCYTCGTEWKHKRQQCQCKLWDERNIVRTPLDSDDESDDDDDDMYDFVDDDDEDFVEDEHMVEDLFGYDEDVDDFDDLDYDDDFFVGDEHHMHMNALVHGFGELTGVDRMIDRIMLEPPGPPPFPNRFFKTKLCRYYLRPGGCKDGRLCHFAHGDHELRHI